MGLLYVLPLSEDEKDRVEIISDHATGRSSILLKSYGLPYIFWGYYAAICLIIVVMFLAIHAPLDKLFASSDPIDKSLSVLVYSTMLLIPLILSGHFFYEKILEKSGTSLTVSHRLFGITVRRKTLALKNDLPFEVMNFRASPNMARLQQNPEMRAFYNQGYFELFARLENDQMVYIDRHSRKADLLKMTELLLKY